MFNIKSTSFINRLSIIPLIFPWSRGVYDCAIERIMIIISDKLCSISRNKNDNQRC